MLVSPASADFSCSANEVGLELPLGNARTKRASWGCVKVGEKWILAIPEEISSCAKLRSPAADPNGTPSNKIWVPDAPSRTPLPPLSSSALRNSFHVVSNCAAVRTCPNSYRRANFSRMLRLRTKARAEARVSVAINYKGAATSRVVQVFLLQYGDPAEETSFVWSIVPISITFSANKSLRHGSRESPP